jgi:hypothetical protein
MKNAKSTQRTRPASPSMLAIPPRDPGDGYIAIMEGQLAVWSSRIDRLHDRAAVAAANGDTTLQRRAEASRAMRKDLSRRLQELRGAGPDHVRSLRAGLALAWRQFTAQVGRGLLGSPAQPR